MIAALIVAGAWQTHGALILILGLLAGARAGVVSLHVRRPPVPRKPNTEVPSA